MIRQSKHMHCRSRRRHWSLLGSLVAAGAICLLLSGAMSADGNGDEVGNVRTALEKWVETRRLISKERRDWELGREMLNDRIALVQREIESLRGKITDAEGNIAEADKKRAELIDENQKLKEDADALAGTVIALESRTAQLLQRLPDPIRERVQPLSQRLPSDPDEAKLSLSQRFQGVVGIINEVDKFNREITTTSEVHTLSDGTAAEVTAIYVGIGHGYYVTGNQSAAAVGSATADAWIWTPALQEAASIADAIAILKNEKVPDFVRLPVDIE